MLNQDTLAQLAGWALFCDIPGLDVAQILSHNGGVLQLPLEYDRHYLIQDNGHFKKIFQRLDAIPCGTLRATSLERWWMLVDLRSFSALCMHLDLNDAWGDAMAITKPGVVPDWQDFVERLSISAQHLSSVEFLQGWKDLLRSGLDVRKPDHRNNHALRALTSEVTQALPEQALRTILAQIVTLAPNLVSLKGRDGHTLFNAPKAHPTLRDFVIELAKSIETNQHISNSLRHQVADGKSPSKRRF